VERAEERTSETAVACDVRVVHLDRVIRARGQALDDRDVEGLSRLYKALSDPTRLRLVLALRDGEMCVCDLAATLAMTESAVSHQLRRLRELSLVRTRRNGQIVYYALDDGHVADLLGVGLAHVAE
jgi:DNA-binding transcriptional ArsR family regulator